MESITAFAEVLALVVSFILGIFAAGRKVARLEHRVDVLENRVDKELDDTLTNIKDDIKEIRNDIKQILLTKADR